MARFQIRFLALMASAFAALLLISCGGGDGGEDVTPTPAATPTSAAADEGVVVVTISGGCDRPQPELGTEALALVRVVTPDGSPVIGAQVHGEAEGPGVVRNAATDATYLDGEALLLFPVNQPGPYTMTVVRITLPDGEPAVFDPSSTLATTFQVGEVCTPP